jgi:hypothetical protein
MLSSKFKVGDHVIVKPWPDLVQNRDGTGVGLGIIVEGIDNNGHCYVQFGYISTRENERRPVHCSRMEKVEIPQE